MYLQFNKQRITFVIQFDIFFGFHYENAKHFAVKTKPVQILLEKMSKHSCVPTNCPQKIGEMKGINFKTELVAKLYKPCD